MKSEQYREKKILIFTPNSAGQKTILLPYFTREQCGYSKLVARGKDFQKLLFSKKSFDLVFPLLSQYHGDL